jgi:GNAT superfamily N-acetyltransferase
MITITGGIIETEFGHVWWDLCPEDGGYVELYTLFIEQKYRGNGLARALLIAAKCLAEKQYPGIPIKITPAPTEDGIDTKRLADFYSSLGLIVHYPASEKGAA